MLPEPLRQFHSVVIALGAGGASERHVGAAEDPRQWCARPRLWLIRLRCLCRLVCFCGGFRCCYNEPRVNVPNDYLRILARPQRCRILSPFIDNEGNSSTHYSNTVQATYVYSLTSCDSIVHTMRLCLYHLDSVDDEYCCTMSFGHKTQRLSGSYCRS